MPTIAAATRLVSDMEQELTELFGQSARLNVPEVQMALERKARQAEANTERIEEWGGEALASGQKVSKSVRQKWHDLRARAELSERRVRLCRPESAEEFASTLLWVAEKGELEDLALLKVIKRNPPFPLESLLNRAERRINERYDDLYLRLRNFFGIGQGELARALDASGARGDVKTARQVQRTIESLEELEELLQMQFESQEIRRWLHAPNSMFDGNSPVNLIARGETDRISHLLIRLAEGIHY
jgi:hypothetical protein